MGDGFSYSEKENMHIIVFLGTLSLLKSLRNFKLKKKIPQILGPLKWNVF